jgi:hypothetical protein
MLSPVLRHISAILADAISLSPDSENTDQTLAYRYGSS